MPLRRQPHVVHVGDIDDEPLGAGNGRYGYGNYTVVDLGGRLFLDPAPPSSHRSACEQCVQQDLLLGLGFGVNDNTGDPYVVHDLGLPRTFSAYYTYSF